MSATIALPFALLKDGRTERDLDPTKAPADEDAGSDRFRRVRCPKCEWRPRRTDRWQCTCLHVWNTFDTSAVCPACKFRWPWTECLQCHARSAHQDWYLDRTL
ncbi:MAG TPA: hypothetical protein VE549_00525 [Myxococcaceae bacterium]|nr:hypothetical protein [Myxococcaceae bacterium]